MPMNGTELVIVSFLAGSLWTIFTVLVIIGVRKERAINRERKLASTSQYHRNGGQS